MKRIIYSLFALTLISIGSKAQVYTVNNSVNFSANFNNLQTAINTVPAGSVLLVQGSGTSYGSVVLDKQLMILGPGYNLNINPPPHTQADRLSANISDFRIKSGASGAVVSGMQFGMEVRFDTVNNILFQSNFCLAGIQLTRSNSINITKCNLKNSSTNYDGGIVRTYYSTAVQVNNNLFEKQNYGVFIYVYNDNGVSNPDLSSVTAEFNTFLWNAGSNSSSSTAFSLYGYTSGQAELILRNNIMANKLNSPAVKDFSLYVPFSNGNDIISMSNNVVHDSSFAGTNGVVNDASPAAMFLHWGNTAYAYDYICQDKAGSPAIGAGVGGTNCGMYGGNTPYAISGLSLIPNIYDIQMPTIGTTGYGIDVRIKARANQ